jgi:hypothetical protein
MEHPLIGKLTTLTVDELSAQINDLNRKLSIAMRSGNGALCNQIRMAISSYQNQYQEKLRESYKQSNTNFDDKIDIQ